MEDANTKLFTIKDGIIIVKKRSHFAWWLYNWIGTYENCHNSSAVGLGKSWKNRKYFEEKIKSIQEEIDLVVLPEMFSTGFTMHPENVSETMDGETLSLLKSLAKAKNTAITGSLIIRENGKFYNRLVFCFFFRRD